MHPIRFPSRCPGRRCAGSAGSRKVRHDARARKNILLRRRAISRSVLGALLAPFGPPVILLIPIVGLVWWFVVRPSTKRRPRVRPADTNGRATPAVRRPLVVGPPV